jgi:arginyl-tRNA synthetase
MSSSLPASVAALSLQSTEQRSKIPGCFPTLNPMDIYREHIATEISKFLNVDAEKIYPRLVWTSTLDKGDLSLPVCDTCRIESIYRLFLL